MEPRRGANAWRGIPLDPRIGGASEYRDIPGTLLVTGIDATTETHSDFPDAVVVLFEFTPQRHSDRQSNRFDWPDQNVRLEVTGGFDPPLRWILDADVRVGQAYGAVRREIVRGTCTPVVYDSVLHESFYKWLEATHS